MPIVCMFLATLMCQEKVEIMSGGPYFKGGKNMSNVVSLMEVIKIRMLYVNTKLAELNFYFNLEI